MIWLSAITLVLLITFVSLTDAHQFDWLIWALGAVTLFWMLVPKPVSGMRVTKSHLILSAWRDPYVILLDDIAYLRATEASAETNMALVFKNGIEAGVFVGDLPDVETLVMVMAARGIPVRDVY
ncbi:hypothetical protein ACJ5NV_00440 [Loktanella agnita]|uniref:hypothetical protein n=1 Tax=Loktanella agnita TaxID=287097 RepID=UPI00398701EB